MFLRLFKDCKIGWWTSIILTVVFTSVYICVYKVAVKIIFISSTRGASDSAEDIYNNNNDGRRGAGRPKLTWKKLTERDCREWKLTTVDPQERSTWRSGVGSAMGAASQLPGKGPTDVDDAPAPAR